MKRCVTSQAWKKPTTTCPLQTGASHVRRLSVADELEEDWKDYLWRLATEISYMVWGDDGDNVAIYLWLYFGAFPVEPYWMVINELADWWWDLSGGYDDIAY